MKQEASLQLLSKIFETSLVTTT